MITPNYGDKITFTTIDGVEHVGEYIRDMFVDEVGLYRDINTKECVVDVLNWEPRK